MNIEDIRNNALLNEFKENPVRYLKNFAMDIIVVVVALAYIFYQMVQLEPQNVNPLVLIAQAFMGIVCGVVIKQALGENGFSKGYNSQKWIEEEHKYNEACNLANGYMERVDNFYLCEEIEKKRNYRRQHLQAIRLKYEDWFDYEGNYIGDFFKYNELDKRQKKALNKCIKVKIYVLNLFSEYSTSTEQDTKREMTDKMQRHKNLTKNTLSATIIAIVGVYFVPLFNGWSWATLIASTMQVSLWVLFGVLQLYSNYGYVVQDKVALLRRKKETIVRFTTGCEKELYKTNPYDDFAQQNSLQTNNVVA